MKKFILTLTLSSLLSPLVFGMESADSSSQTNKAKQKSTKTQMISHETCDMVMIPEHDVGGMVSKVLAQKKYAVTLANKVIPDTMHITVAYKRIFGLWHRFHVEIVDNNTKDKNAARVLVNRTKTGLLDPSSVLTRLIPECKITSAPVPVPPKEKEEASAQEHLAEQ